MSFPFWDVSRMQDLHLYRSNRLEALSENLAEVISAPLKSVMQSELIIVQSLGMRRWLSMTLASQLGVTMNCEFLFPADFIKRVFDAAFPGQKKDRAFDRKILPWRVLKHLPEMLDEPGFDELQRYLQGDSRTLKEFQLAQKVGTMFDSYLAYRPKWLLEWQSGDQQSWQAQLWRALAAGHQEAHAPALATRLMEALAQGQAKLTSLPERICIFGVSSLPPLYFNILQEISRHLKIHFFVLDPTELYWGDIQSRKEQDRFLKRVGKAGVTAEDLHLDLGNPLLASMGKAGRDFTRLLMELEPTSEKSLFRNDPEPRHLLAHLQEDIFQLEEGSEPAPIPMGADDASVQVHCCHSAMRELEVLHDQLLALFEADKSLTPRDILVTMPDVESYAPFIEAVFGAPESADVAIPYSIADRTARAESAIADVFLRLLDLTGSRFGISVVFSLLETPVIQRRFELSESDLTILRAWARKTGIRWGIDAAHRGSIGQPEFSDNTWRAGLRRLLLGYALPGDDRTLYEDTLPVREVEGTLAETLGHFVDFAESLFQHIRELEEPRPLAEWNRTLGAVLDAFFSDDDEFTDELQRIRRVLEGLAEAQKFAEFTTAVEFAAIREHLVEALADTDSGIGFLSGSVTFCALKPMRSIPFKVICMLGMNDTAFPRHATPPAFDLAAAQPRPGDRNLRDDDRHLFLETLLSARETLYISYSGISNRDNKEAPPCAPVSELLDYLETRFPLPDGGSRKSVVVRKHRLQPFSGAYFSGSGPLFSYSRENCRACAQARAPREPLPPFARAEVSEPEVEWRQIDWERLASFFANPARFFARDRLGLALPGEVIPFEDCEPQTLDGLDRYRFEQDVIHDAIKTGSVPGNALQVARATGALPPGYPGDSDFQALSRSGGALATRVCERIHGDSFPPIPVDLDFDGWRVSGVVRELYSAGLLRHYAANVRVKHLLNSWIAHLVLQCARPTGGPFPTLLFGKDKTVKFRPLADPQKPLADLVALYAQGLRKPLPFFPETSHEFARRTLFPSKQTRNTPLDGARTVWLGNDYTAAESDDAWYQLCFRDAAVPLDAVWEDNALRVFGPLLEHKEEETDA